MNKLELLKSKIKNLLCELNYHHDWIYIGEKDKNIFEKRYCENCRKQEQFCNGHYYRIGNISYEEMRSKY